jgi:hypothetical protein
MTSRTVELTERLRELSAHMKAVSAVMASISSLGPAVAQHALELRGAASLVDGWTAYIEDTFL